jgi:hypothetical protein
MGWWDDESVGQRTARLQGENAKRMHEATRERDDINHQRLRQTAKDDPVKIRRAMQFNPLFVGKIAVLTALDLMKARSARKKAGTE